MLTIEKNDEEGYYMLLQDESGMCKSKSRNVLVRIRDALNAVAATSLIGHTVEENGGEHPRGVVLAIAGNDLIVRLSSNKLDSWNVRDCCIIEPEHKRSTCEWHDPAIGVMPAVALLHCWLQLSPTSKPEEVAVVAAATEKFIEMREAAQPSNF